MKLLKSVLFFFINAIWYVLLMFFPLVKWGLSLACVFSICIWIFSDGNQAFQAGMTAGGLFLVLTLIYFFISEYKP